MRTLAHLQRMEPREGAIDGISWRTALPQCTYTSGVPEQQRTARCCGCGPILPSHEGDSLARIFIAISTAHDAWEIRLMPSRIAKERVVDLRIESLEVAFELNW